MSSTGAELSETHPKITSEHGEDASHGDTVTTAKTEDTVTNGGEAVAEVRAEMKITEPAEGITDVLVRSTDNEKSSSSHEKSNEIIDRDGSEGAQKEQSECSAVKESSQDMIEFEKLDSAAASAGSSPPHSSAAQDDLQMDTDAREESEGDKDESSIEKEHGVDEEKEESKKEIEQPNLEQEDEKMETSDAEKDHDDEVVKDGDEGEKKEEVSGKRAALPKWMVQDADAPPSPKEEEVEDSGKKASEVVSRGRGRGKRGRGGLMRSSVKPNAEVANEQSQPELSSGRPRRSTRSNIDYAHPDVATVVAEQDDLENEIQQKVSRGRGRGRARVARIGRGGSRRRKTDDASEDGEDSGSEYGASKRAKKSLTGSARGRGRGRGRPRGKSIRGAAKHKRSKNEDSDDEDEEMDLADDDATGSTGSGNAEGDGEDNDEGNEEAYKPTPSKRRAPASMSPNWKQPPKKRGRVSTKNDN